MKTEMCKIRYYHGEDCAKCYPPESRKNWELILAGSAIWIMFLVALIW